MALGRGLGELLGEVETAYGNSNSNKNVSNNDINKIKISLIKVNPNQPRKIFDEDKLKELSDSIKEHGLLQAIVVTKNDDETYTLIAGERRLRAHKMASIDEINAVIMNSDELKLRELALIENIQREDLNIIELAFCYAQLLNEHNITHEELSKKVSKSRTSITNTLRLLQLSSYVQQYLSSSKISAGHAKVMIGLDNEMQKTICDKIIEEDLSVRQCEKLIKDFKESKNKVKSNIVTKSYNTQTLESFLNILKEDKIKAKIDKNSIKITFNSQEDIDRIISYLNIQ
ncbi:Chromosome-partitioning protein Spo0J [Aliarcobacter thereius]|uniref:Chromosome-partitioning protein Spo0J n=2 Tax=Aliarcobacter thereius TaxID=544718 RepID=A0A1C0B7W8_9BACT|nr:ParB/RepB/Spo0J family partition protein [Aliarcobacter thereius]OCL87826.1 Chromosome-partitioning protein Spo0J [Aliarcobacter thereius]OCL94082.1 Chromosome-partitioning protein Spo0J [Aliarcobacter thereius]OCL95476.1 Chromosome-partitioning protein Spo0J [Aliarcobacter thereius LMG 24486]OCL99622.1 Chromosome-partitioning protein Spo0J [Aliarcobacter thereius]QBF16537.1 chromosome partitioning protein [Aliarcobacter thereius LMG 24486]